MSRAVAPLALAVLLLAGCSSAGEPDLRSAVGAATEAANAGDADGLREAADRLAEQVAQEREDGTLPGAEADRLLALAATLEESAELADPEVRARRQAEAEAEAARAEAEDERARRVAAEEAAQEAAAREQAARDAAEAAEKGKPDEDEKGEGKGKEKDDEGDEGDD